VQLTPAAFKAAGVTPEMIFSLVGVTALCFHAYQQVSYMVLSRVSPVSHSIGNTLKVRVQNVRLLLRLLFKSNRGAAPVAAALAGSCALL
jgi:solute carrier family 35, member E1